MRFPAPTVISDLVVVCHSSYPGPCRTELKIPEVHCALVHPTCSLKIPLCLLETKSSQIQRALDIGRDLRTMAASTCTLERITLSALKRLLLGSSNDINVLRIP